MLTNGRGVGLLVWALVAVGACGDDNQVSQLPDEYVLAVSTAEDTPVSATVEIPDAVEINLEGSPMHGTLTMSGSGNRYEYTYTPAANYSGTDIITVRYSDGRKTGPGRLDITVTPVNDAPVAANDSVNAAQDTPLDIDPATLLANDTDIDGDSLAFVSVSGGTNGTAAVESGHIVFTPRAGFNGNSTFNYTISDGTTTAQGLVTATVAPDNAPVAAADTGSVDEDGNTTINVLANDTDPDNDTLTVINNSNAGHGTLSRSGGVFTYTPTANYNGPDTFTYTIADGHGKVATGTVTITVNAINDPPVAVTDTANGSEDTDILILVVPNDTDIDGDTLSVSGNTTPAHGTIVLAGNQFTYTPAQNYFGFDAFDYTISDGHGGTATTTVNISLLPVNDSPVAVDDTATTAEDTPIGLNLRMNDSDVDGDTLILSGVTQPAHGNVSAVGTVVQYTPAPNYSGPDAFTYTISDGHGGSATGNVAITVTPSNDGPDAVNDNANANEDSPVAIDVLVNDSDPDNDPISVVSFTTPAHGSISQTGNVLTYTPAANYNGIDQFNYTISDGTGMDAATVRITVAPVNDPPIARNDELGVENDETFHDIDVIANDADLENDLLTVINVATPSSGTATIVGNKVRYVPVLGFMGTVTFAYVVSDGNGGTATADIILNVIEASVCGDGIVSGSEECDPGCSKCTVSEDVILGGFFSRSCNQDCTFKCFSGTGADAVYVDYEGSGGTANCYALYTQPTTWSNAASLCATRGGHLATITGSHENQNVYEGGFRSWEQFQTGDVWIGAAGSGSGAPDNIEWITGEDFDFSIDEGRTPYTNWEATQPDATTNSCVFMELDPDFEFASNDPGPWFDNSCSNQEDYVCELDAGLFGGGTFPGMTGAIRFAMRSPDPLAKYEFELCDYGNFGVSFKSAVLSDGVVNIDFDPYDGGLVVYMGNNVTWGQVVAAINAATNDPFRFRPPLPVIATLTNSAADSAVLAEPDSACDLILSLNSNVGDTCFGECKGDCFYCNF